MKIKTPDSLVLGAGPDEYVRCRTYGHAWNDAPNDWAEEDYDGIPMTVTCMRCGMERRDTLRANGTLLRRSYQYPVGYLLAKGVKRPARDAFRLRLLALKLRNAR